MGAPTALAAVTVSARRRGLPQHRGQTPEPAKRIKLWLCRLGIQSDTPRRDRPTLDTFSDEDIAMW
jgi:hypothetical protein